MTLVIRSDPPLLVTHVPLTEVPDGWVNVHGHEHAFKPLRRGRWINVSVEQTLYRPLDVRTQIIPLAKALVARRMPPGLTTAERSPAQVRVLRASARQRSVPSRLSRACSKRRLQSATHALGFTASYTDRPFSSTSSVFGSGSPRADSAELSMMVSSSKRCAVCRKLCNECR